MSPFDPIAIPDWAWRGESVQTALRARDAGGILRVAQRYAGASQHRIANLVGIPQGRISEILKGTRRVAALDVFERIADGLGMPDHARFTLGLAPSRAGKVGEPAVLLGDLVRVFSDQAAAAEDIQRLAASATRLDVLAVRALGVIALNDSLLRGSLAGERAVSVRVLLLDPESLAATRRAGEIGESAESFGNGIRMSLSRLRELSESVRLEVHLYDSLPTWRLLGLDDTLYVSTFADRWEGHESPTYKVVKTEGGALYHGFRRMFDDLRDRATQVI
jgi:transcriptional regulator with XRE-family HTH domain